MKVYALNLNCCAWGEYTRMDAMVREICFVLYSTLFTKTSVFYCFNPKTVLKVSREGFIINTLQRGKLSLKRDLAGNRQSVKC